MIEENEPMKPAPTGAKHEVDRLQRQVDALQRQLELARQRPSEAVANARMSEVLEQACKWVAKHQRTFGLAALPHWHDEAQTILENGSEPHGRY